MKPAALDLHRWSRRRWIGSIGAAFAVQLALVWVLGERLRPPPLPTPDSTSICLAADPWATRQLLDWPGLEDPTLFALPNPHGFSGAAWLTYNPLHYELKDWSEPPRWLALDPRRLGQAFTQLVGTNPWPSLLIADQPMPRSIIPDFNPLAVPVLTQSECRLEGELASRRWLAPPALPSWPRTELLTNSIVELMVDAEGLVFSTRLLGSSGLPEADQYALAIATQARFPPIWGKASQPTAGPFTFGRLIFSWHTVLPPATNAVPPIPPPP